MIEEEIWKPIKDYENLYEVSNKGRIKSLQRTCKSKGGKIRAVNERILKPVFLRNYYYINLNNSNIDQFRIHRLVAIHFIPNPLNLPYVNHLDGDKLNNNDWNLEWTTHQENMNHAKENGLILKRKGEDAPNSKLTQLQIDNIKLRLSNKETGRSIANLYNISEGMVSLIKHNKNWKDDNSD